MGRTKPLVNLNGQVTEILALRIISGDYGVGALLPTEKELHGSLGVSRTTLREAVKSLTSKGLVSVGSGVGTRVRPYALWNLLDPDMLRWRLQLGATPALVKDMYELRECFEPAASRLAAERGSEAERGAIWQAYLDLAASRETGGERSVDADVRFHATILRSAGNDLLAAFANVIEGTLTASFAVARERNNLSKSDIAQHGAIAKAIAKGDGPAAKRATERMLKSSKSVQMEAVAPASGRPRRGKSSP